MTRASHLVRALERFPDLERLPSPSPVVLRLTEMAARADVTLSEFARTLRSDAALAGRVLAFANSAAVQRRSVASVEQAVLRIGLNGVRRLALAFSVLDANRSGPCVAFDYRRHWAGSLARAIAAEQFAKLTGRAPPEDCFTLGLLSDIGSLALATLRPKPYAELLRAHGADEDELSRAEAAAFAITHRGMTALLLTDWRLPAELVEAATGVAPVGGTLGGAADRLAGVFDAAGAVQRWSVELGVSPLDPRVAEWTGLDAAEIDEVVEVTALQWDAWKRDLQLEP